MTTAAVVYCSRTGITRRYAEEIGRHLTSRGLATSVASVGDADFDAVAAADVVLLGSWTSGLMVVLQHPDGPWVSFVRRLPPLRGTVGLFTTYKLLTGSMFGRMRAELPGAPTVRVALKSRNGQLSEADRRALDALADAAKAG